MENRWTVFTGYVVEENERDSPFLEAFLPELIPLKDGELTADRVEIETEIEGTEEVPREGSFLEVSNTLKCEFLGNDRGSSIPDTMIGEKLRVFKMKGDQRYFWLPYRETNELREKEHIRWRAMDKKHHDPPKDERETYFMEIETDDSNGRKRGFRIVTGDGRGEKYVYNFFIDTVKYRVILEDSEGNFVEMRTPQRQIELQNADGTYVHLNRHDIQMYAPNNIEAEADNDIDVQAGNDIKAYAGNDITAFAEQNIKATAGVNIEARAESDITAMAVRDIEARAGNQIDIESGMKIINRTKEIIIEAEKTNVEGDMNIEGELEVEGLLTATGGLMVHGDVIVTGTIYGDCDDCN